MLIWASITKTCLYNVDPHKPHSFKVKLGFTGVYIIFFVLLANIDCGYSLQPPRRGGSNEYPQSMFWSEIWKISEFLSEKFHFFGDKIFSILKRHVFVMRTVFRLYVESIFHCAFQDLKEAACLVLWPKIPLGFHLRERTAQNRCCSHMP